MTNETTAVTKRSFPASMIAADATCAIAITAAGVLLAVNGAFAAPETADAAKVIETTETVDLEIYELESYKEMVAAAAKLPAAEESVEEETVVAEKPSTDGSISSGNSSGNSSNGNSGTTTSKPAPAPVPVPAPVPAPEPPPRVFTDADARNAIASRYGASASLEMDCATLNYGTWGGSDPWTATPPAPRMDRIGSGILGWSASASGGGGMVTYYACY
jgi:hypothetical protein